MRRDGSGAGKGPTLRDFLAVLAGPDEDGPWSFNGKVGDVASAWWEALPADGRALTGAGAGRLAWFTTAARTDEAWLWAAERDATAPGDILVLADVVVAAYEEIGTTSVVPIKRTMPGDRTASPATLFGSSGDPWRDPATRPGRGAPLATSRGTPAGLASLLDAAALVGRDRRGRDGAMELRPSCPGSDEPAELAFSWHPVDPATLSLVSALLADHGPTGHDVEPTTPWTDRESCVGPVPTTVPVPRTPTGSSSLRAAARVSAERVLRAWAAGTGEKALGLVEEACR